MRLAAQLPGHHSQNRHDAYDRYVATDCCISEACRKIATYTFATTVRNRTGMNRHRLEVSSDVKLPNLPDNLGQ